MKKFMKLFSRSSKTASNNGQHPQRTSADDQYYNDYNQYNQYSQFNQYGNGHNNHHDIDSDRKSIKSIKRSLFGGFGNHSSPDLRSSVGFRSRKGSLAEPAPPIPSFPQQYRRPSAAAKLPNEILARIFTYVAPHVDNESLYSEEEVHHYVNNCVLCDTRDLARFALVCLKWSRVAQSLLYRNIQLERTHYCGREEELDELRKRRSRVIYTDPDTIDTAAERVDLLVRTLRTNEELGMYTLFIRLQYMTRESCKQGLASLVNTPLINLRWMDLPDGFYKDDASCQSLKAIMYQKCPDLRRMRWTEGAEAGFLGLPQDRPWTQLEFVELHKLNVEEDNISAAISTLPKLNSLGLQELPWASDRLLAPNGGMRGRPLLPPLVSLSLTNCPEIKVEGVLAYVSTPAVQHTLESFTLKEMSFPPHLLYKIISSLPRLKVLHFTGPVTRMFPKTDSPPHPPLYSTALRELSYEVHPATQAKSLANPASSYYEYLIDSLRQGGLPALKTLHVRDEGFHKSLKRVTDSMSPAGREGIILQRLETITFHARGWNGLVWTTFRLNQPSSSIMEGVEELDEFSALVAAAGGSPRPQPNGGAGGYLGVPGVQDEKRLSWRERRDNRRSRMDLWR